MCRLITSDKRDYLLYDKSYGILNLMHHLETQCGGHGNGFALVKDREIITWAKGMTLTNEEIYKQIARENDWDYMIYHTRIASIGTQSDKNCHPFISKNNALAMNGTVYDFHDIAGVLDKTDSELIFKLVRGLGKLETAEALASISAIFVGFSDGIPYATKGTSGDLRRYKKGNSSFHASSFPVNVPQAQIAETFKGYIWLNGKIIEEGKPPMPTSKYTYSTAAYLNDYDETYTTGTRGYTIGTREWEEGYEAGHEEGYMEGYADGQASWQTEIEAKVAYDMKRWD